jgi:hypothetical protein
MSDPGPLRIAGDLLLGKLREQSFELRRCLRDLAGQPELLRRHILQPHEEAVGKLQPGEDDETAFRADRARIDRALEALTIFELGCEAGLVTKADNPLGEDSTAFGKLCDSEGFLRYANAYLYFGVRFLAGRLYPPAWFTGTPKSEAPAKGDLPGL